MEISNIFDIGFRLKYPKKVLDVSLRKARKTFYSVDNRPPPNFKNLLVLPFNTNLIGVPRLLKSFNVNVVFNNKSIKNIVIKNSPVCTTGCIYKIPCKHCNKMYVGQTGKGLQVRLNQHRKCVRDGSMSSALFVHMNDTNHGIDWENSQEIVKCQDVTKRNIIESCIIKNGREDLINLSDGLFKLDSFIIQRICSSFKM